jgi:large subunit ribosomal protein L10
MAIKAKKIQQAKADSIETIKDRFGEVKDFIFTDYRGLTVAKISDLRKQLRAKGAEYKVIKNNFARIAMEELKYPDVQIYLTGPTAIALAKDDSGAVAKILLDFAKENPLKVKGGLIDKNVFTAVQIDAFSRLPSRLQLISMMMSAMNGPATGVVGALNAVPTKLVRTLQAVVDQKAAAGA